jgi:membrane protease YdiL (CAAX protease family)
MGVSPWLHIVAAYLIYIVIAILASMLIGRIAGDLKHYKVRNSPRVLFLVASVNLIVLFAILLLIVFWDKKPTTSIGLQFQRDDGIASLTGFAVTFMLAIGFLYVLRRGKQVDSVQPQLPVTSSPEVFQMGLGLVVLMPVILQEEVLNRAYVTLNLLPLGAVGIILTSTVIFVLIHFLTNRANVSQVVSWIVSGLVLVISYLLSGSIWVPIVLHYATDTTNVLVFNITGQFSFFQTTPAVTEGQRTTFRVIYGLLIVVTLFAIYGLKFQFG